MADDNDMSEETPEEVTMKDLWRFLSGFRAEVNRQFDEAKTERAKLQDESSIIRSEMLELASHKDFVELDDKIAVIANDSKATRQDVRNIKAELSRLKADVRKAGIPVG